MPRGSAMKTPPPVRGAVRDFELFTPLKLGPGLELKNRVVMAPLSRGRAGHDRVPNETNAIYYEQRAGAGLIITEGTGISEQGYGWYHAAAMYTAEHADGWKRVVDRVHAKGGKIFLQLWHMGRQGHSSFNSSKHEIVAPSAIRLETGHTRTQDYEQAPYETPRALETQEIADVVEDYRRSAELAKGAGFDGVEVHAANGYLIDQFLQSTTNKRTDQYGCQSFENRARLLLEVVQALKTVFDSYRIGVRVSPNGAFAGMGSADNLDLFTYVFEKLSEEQPAYVAVLDGFGFGRHDKGGGFVTAHGAKRAFGGNIMANCSYTRDIAEGAVRSGAADLVSFGRPFISNPDLVERFQHDWSVTPDPDYEVYYRGGAVGYIDFPAYDVSEKEEKAPATGP